MPAPIHQLQRRIRNNVRPNHHILWLRHPILELPIVLQQQPTQRNLDLVAREEATRTRVQAMPEPQGFGRGGDKLPIIFLAGLPTELEEAIGIEGFWVGEDGRVEGSVGDNSEVAAFRDGLAIGKREGFFGDASERGWLGRR